MQWPCTKAGPMAGAAVRGRLLKGAQAGHGIGAVDLGKVEVGEVGHQARDVAARRVHFHRNADGVAVVFHQKMTGSFWLEAVFSASQNSPCEVEPSPTQASTTSSP